MEQLPHRSRMSFLDEASSKLSSGKIKTFEETCYYGFEEISRVVYHAMNLKDNYERKRKNKRSNK